MKHFTIAAAATALATAASPALAHVGGHGTSGFLAGLAHPIGGLDHVLAMLAVGLWAGAVGGRAVLAWPATFVAVMVAAALAGMAGPWISGVELAIAASVAALGLAVALRLRAPTALGALACAAFALAHGWAHGAELPLEASAAGYVAGFALSTAALHAVGVTLATLLARDANGWAVRGAGGAVAAMGVVLMVA